MNFRLTAVLFGLVFALAVGLFALALTATDPSAKTYGPFEPLRTAGVTPADVDRLELTRTRPRQETLVFRKANGQWRLTAPADAPVDSAAIDVLVKGLLDARPADYAGTTDPALIGLGESGLKITLARGETTTAALVGSTSMGKENAVTFFAPANDPKRVIPVRTADLRSALFRKDSANKDGDSSLLVKWRSDFRTTQVLGLDPRAADTQVERVAVAVGDKKTDLEKVGGEWRFAGVWATYGPADFGGSNTPDPAITGVRELLNAVLTLQTNGPVDVTEDLPAERWKEFGLADGDPEAVQVEISQASKPATWVRIGKPVLDEKTGQPVLPPRRYCRVKDDAALFKVSTEQKERLVVVARDPAALRNRDLLPLAKLERYDAVDGTAGGGFQLRRMSGGPSAKWAVYGGPPPAEGNMQAIRGLLAALATPRAALDILPMPDDTAFDTAAVSLTLWADAVPAGATFDKDGKPPAAPTPKGDPVKLTFGKKGPRKVAGVAEEKVVVIVRREQGTEKTDFAVPAELATAFTRSRLAFVNTLLPSFVPEAATSLVLSPGPGGQRVEFTKDPKATDPAYPRGVWKAGDATADADAVLDLLRLLANPSAVPAIETDAPPKEFGLDPATPVLRAKVTLPADKPDGKPREVEYLFGNPPATDPKDGPKNVYLRAVGGGVVFSVPADKLDRLRTADVTDKVVLRIDPGKVKVLVLNGWAKDVNGKRESTSATLQLSDGVWTNTEPGGKPADQSRARDWVGALRAVKRIGKAELVNGKEPESWGFASAPVSVIAGDDKNKSLGMLTLGALDGKGGLYVRLDSEQKYYLVDAAAFAPLLPAPPLK